MDIRSAKKKGRRLCLVVKEMLLEAAPELDAGDLAVNPASCPGEDIWLSPAARKVYPLAFECKNQETAHVWKWIAQAKGYAKDGRCPVVVFSRNKEPEPYVIVSLRDFLFLMVDQSGLDADKEPNGALFDICGVDG